MTREDKRRQYKNDKINSREDNKNQYKTRAEYTRQEKTI